MTPLVHGAGLVSHKEANSLKTQRKNIQKMVARAMQKGGSGGSISDDRKSLVEAATVLSVSTPQASPEALAAGSK